MTCLKFARAVSLALVCGCLHAPARAATFVVSNTADSGPGSLRQSLLAAAAVADGVENRIEFQLSNPPFRIQPLSQLPDLQGPIVIDGFTQPGFTGRPLIELRGDRADDSSLARRDFIDAAEPSGHHAPACQMTR